MSRNVRFKLSEEEYRVVLQASAGLGITVDALARQALAFTLSQARKLSETRQAAVDRDAVVRESLAHQTREAEKALGIVQYGSPLFANPGDEDEAQQDSTSSLDKAST